MNLQKNLRSLLLITEFDDGGCFEIFLKVSADPLRPRSTIRYSNKEVRLMSATSQLMSKGQLGVFLDLGIV